MRERKKVTAEDQLGLMAAVNRGMIGGEEYNKYAKRLARRAGLKESNG